MSDTKLPWANKDLGQHFLRDQKVIDDITNDFADVAEAMVEVGPGPGILTRFLCQHDLPFEVIEKDERFPEYLKEYIPEDKINLTDALQVDYSEFFSTRGWSEKKVWLVSNLPYNVGSPLLVKFLQVPEIKLMTLMFQKEVVGKIVAPAEKKKNVMGSLMALSQTYFECKYLCTVLPGAFQPPPKVDSAVVSMQRIENPEVPLSEFLKYESFLRKLFAMKRKQMGKVLKSHFSAEKLASALETCGLERTLRAEVLTLEQVIALYRALCN